MPLHYTLHGMTVFYLSMKHNFISYLFLGPIHYDVFHDMTMSTYYDSYDLLVCCQNCVLEARTFFILCGHYQKMRFYYSDNKHF